MRQKLLIWSLLILLLAGCESPGNKRPIPPSYQESRKNFKTNLLVQGEAPQFYEEFDATLGSIKAISFESGNFKLKALLDTTNIESGKRKPVVIYLHGGFSLGYSDMGNCQPFIDAGYIVLAPTYRGENGNEGNFELFMGEIDDAKAAIKWVSEQPFTDKENIFVFGHSIGGAMSLMLSFHSDVLIKKSGSSSGIYDTATIDYWATEEKIIPFDHRNPDELYFRLPIFTLEYMKRPHYIYIGNEDGFEDYKNFQSELYPNGRTLLRISEVEGDHSTSLSNAMNEFIIEIKK